MTDHKREFLDGVNELLDDMPPRIQGLIRALTDEISAKLGESPEAWRGANEISIVAMRCMMMGREGDEGADFNSNEMMLCSIIAALSATLYGQMAMDARKGGAIEALSGMVDGLDLIDGDEHEQRLMEEQP
jgi:hypothetical protein